MALKSLRTSQEWYLEDKKYDITSPDGWSDSKSPSNYWYQKKITKEEYEERLNMSTITNYNLYSHISPFNNNDDNILMHKIKKSWNNNKYINLGIILTSVIILDLLYQNYSSWLPWSS